MDDGIRQRCRIDVPDFGRRSERHHACASARGSMGGQPAGARYRLTAQYQHVAALVLVAFGLWPRVALQPEVWSVLPCVRDDVFEHRTRYADVGHQDVAAKPAPWIQQVAGLLAKEGHGELGRRSGPANNPGRPVDAAWHIYRAGVYPTLSERLDNGQSFAVQRTRQARSKDRIDHDTGTFEILGRERRH